MQKTKIATKILSFVMFLILATIIVINYLNVGNKYKVFTMMQDRAVLSFMKTVHTLEKQTAKRYFAIASVLQTNPQFIELLQTNNLEKINLILKERFHTLRAEDTNFKHLHLYNKDGIMLLDYHTAQDIRKKDTFNLINNPVLHKAYETKHEEQGFINIDKYFFYSFVIPLFLDKQIIGFIEFAVDIDFNTKIVAKSSHYKYAYYINNDKSNTNIQANSDLGLLVNHNSHLFQKLNMTQNFIYKYANLGKAYHYNNKYYLIHEFDIENINQKDFAQLILFHDVTKEIIENRNYLYLIVGVSTLILLLLFFILFFYINKLSLAITHKELQLQSILDSSENFLIVYKNNIMTDANQRFFHFFNVKNLQEFHEFYNSIEEHFINDSTNFHYDAKNPLHWSIQFQQRNQTQHVIALRNIKHNTINYFNVKFNNLNNDRSSQLVTFSNITDIYKQAKQDKHKANHDQLTGLYNREYFHTIVHEIIHKSSTLSLLMLDIDYFKNVNDTYGHNIGDIILQEFSQIINDNIKHKDILFRWGGEEFIVLLPETKLGDAFILAEQIRVAVAGYSFTEIKHLECSIGITLYHKSTSIISFVEEADLALYEAKETGRNRTTVFQGRSNV